MIGMELVSVCLTRFFALVILFTTVKMYRVYSLKDPVTRTPLPAADIMSIWEQCKDMGVLIGKGGYFGNVSTLAVCSCLCNFCFSSNSVLA